MLANMSKFLAVVLAVSWPLMNYDTFAFPVSASTKPSAARLGRTDLDHREFDVHNRESNESLESEKADVEIVVA